LISALTVALGLWFFFLFVGVREDIYERMGKAAAKMGFGEYTLAHETFVSSKNARKSLSNVKTRLEVLRENHLKGFPRVLTFGFAKSPRSSSTASLLGFDPDLEGAGSNILIKGMLRGRSLSKKNEWRAHILIGDRLAKYLKVDLDSRLVYRTTNIEGDLVSNLGIVSGVFKTGHPETDRYVIALPIDSLREAIGYGKDEASFIAAFVESPLNEAHLKALAKRFEREFFHWTNLQKPLADYMVLDKTVNGVLLVFWSLIVASSVMATMIMSFYDRRREYGVMLSIGTLPSQIFRTMLMESFLITFFGVVLGLVTLLPLYLYMYQYGIDLAPYVGEKFNIGGVIIDFVIRSRLSLANAALIVFGIFALCGLLSVYPSIKAARSSHLGRV
jgi:ABC-type lipoprotein release transport system permease subunit